MYGLKKSFQVAGAGLLVLAMAVVGFALPGRAERAEQTSRSLSTVGELAPPPSLEGSFALAGQQQPGLLPGPIARPPQVGKPGLPSISKATSEAYIQNKGQWDPRALFLAKSRNMDLWLTRTGFVMDYHTIVPERGAQEISSEALRQFRINGRREGHVVAVDFVGSTGAQRAVGSDPRKIRLDYVVGGPETTVRGVPSYGAATLSSVYPGIDLRAYFDGSRPRYDFVVAPGANPRQVQMRFSGAEGLAIDRKSGDLLIETSLGTMRQKGLFAYQSGRDGRVPVPVRFVLKSDDTVGFEVGAYDARRALVIDPIVYGTYMGGGFGGDFVQGLASDSSSTVFMTGSTASSQFPITAGPYGFNLVGGQDAFIAALTGDAYDVTYVAYIGGGGADIGSRVEVDQYGNVWIAGITSSVRYPDDDEQVLSHLNNVPVTDGTFQITLDRAPGPQTTAPLPYNASAAQIEAALDGLSNAPAGGFAVSGGPLTGNPNTTNPITITSPAGVQNLTVNDSILAYRTAAGAGDTQVLFMRNAGALDNDLTGTGTPNNGFAPNQPIGAVPPAGSSFRLSFDGETTNPIPYNATAAQVEAELEALPNIVDVTVTGGPMPSRLTASPLTITFVNPTPPQPLITVNSAALTSADYGFGTSAFKAFVIRFEKSINSILDPVTNPAVFVQRPSADPAFNGLVDFKVRPVPTPTGNVELFLAGRGTPLDLTATPPGGADSFIQKMVFNPQTGQLTIDQAYSRYLGGTIDDFVTAIDVDAQGSLYAVGGLRSVANANLGPSSTLYPTTTGVYPNGGLLRFSDGFVQKRAVDGSLVYSATLGGSGHDDAVAVAADALGNAYVVGVARSFNYPRTRGVFQEIFTDSRTLALVKVNSNGSALLYSTSLNTAGPVTASEVEVDSRGNAYVGGIVGFTIPNPLLWPEPTEPGVISVTPVGQAVPGQIPALDPDYNGGDEEWPAEDPTDIGSTTEGFLTVVNSTATGLLYSSYVGEDGNDDVMGVHVDRTDAVWIYGFTSVLPWAFPGETDDPPVPLGFISTEFVNLGLQSAGIPTNHITPLAFKVIADDFGDGFLVKMRLAQPLLSAVALNPDSSAGGLGATVAGAVSLRDPAPAGGALVTVRVLNPAIARLSATGATSVRVIIPQGQTIGTFTVYTLPVTVPQTADIRAELLGDFLVARLNVRPWFESLTLSTGSIPGGNNVEATVRLFQAAPAGGVVVNMSTDRPDLISFPTSVVVPAGQTSVTFDIGTTGVAADTPVNITAAVLGVGATQPLMLTPAQVAEVSFEPGRVNGGEPTVGTVRLDGDAVEGTVITLSSTGAAITMTPTTLNLDAGEREASFDVTTSAAVGTSTSATVTATLNGVGRSGTLFIDANQIVEVELGATSVLGGTSVFGTVRLDQPASASGFNVPLLVSSPVGTLIPTTVSIAPGSTSGGFVLLTQVVTTLTNVTVTANKPGYNAAADTVAVRPLTFEVTLDPTTVRGGQENSVGTVRLTGGELAGTGGVTLNLSSAVPSAATVPQTVTIPEGASSATFPITSRSVGANTPVTITAAVGGGQASAILTVLPPTLNGLVVTPNPITGGTSGVGTITIGAAAPAGGVTYQLSSNDAVLTVPTSVTVPAGATQVNFPVNTTVTSVERNVNVTATRGNDQTSTVVRVLSQAIEQFTFSPSTVRAGQKSTGTIRLNALAPVGGAVIDLAVVDPTEAGFVTLPATVTIPAGGNSVSFEATANSVSRSVVVEVRATVRSSGATLIGTLLITRGISGG